MIKIDHLDLYTGANKRLIHDLNLCIRPEECWVILGKNGRGKSSLLKAIVGLHQHTGKITINNRLSTDLSTKEQGEIMAYLSQQQVDYFPCTAVDMLHALRYIQSKVDDDLTDTTDYLEKFSLLPVKDQDVRTLSGGERQRLALAMTFAQETPYIFLDEPFSALDFQYQETLAKHLKHDCTDKGVVLISHDPNMGQRLATHVLLLMDNGSWVAGPAQTYLNSDYLSLCFSCSVRTIHTETGDYFIMNGE